MLCLFHDGEAGLSVSGQWPLHCILCGVCLFLDGSVASLWCHWGALVLLLHLLWLSTPNIVSMDLVVSLFFLILSD